MWGGRGDPPLPTASEQVGLCHQKPSDTQCIALYGHGGGELPSLVPISRRIKKSRSRVVGRKEVHDERCR